MVKRTGHTAGTKRSEEVKVFLCGKYPQVNTAQICIRKGEEYGDALRKLILDDRLVPDREDVLALIDYHHDNPVKCKISCNAWTPAYLISIFLTECYRNSDGQR